MAHFAKIGMNGKVIQVTTMDNEEMKDDQGNEVEAKGQEWLERHNNWPAQMWIQTSYNTRGNKYYNSDGTEHEDQTKAFRGNYAGIGYEWDEDNNMFFPKKPFPSWVKDLTNARWISPIGDPPALTAEQKEQNEDDTHMWAHFWNENTQTWDLKDERA